MKRVHLFGEPGADGHHEVVGCALVPATGVVALVNLRALTLTARLFILLLVFEILRARIVAGPVANFEDIQFWVGRGANQSALAIDWDGSGGSDNSLVWGYRWDDVAKGIDMLTAIVMADDRLYAKMGPISGFGFAVVGLGYDANNDGQFALDDDTVFDEHGFNNEVPSDYAQSVDPGDWYAEGWFFSNFFWNYGIASTSPFDGGTWVRSVVGVSSRDLADGSWDSLAYTQIGTQNYARNPLAAEPSGNADFDEDGDVDGRDFLIWQRGFSLVATATHGDGDANGDGNVDGADLSFWSAQYSTNLNLLSAFTGSELQTATLVVPEPSSLVCLCSAAGAWSVFLRYIRLSPRRLNS